MRPRSAVRRRSPMRLVIAAAFGLATAVALASPAFAHVEVSADNPQAGATNVTLTFRGEAESTTAGIKSEQVFLPAGILADQVRLAKAPPGWSFTAALDSFTVAGPALPKGTDAVWSVVVDKLPATASQLVFKTIETYGDGEVVRWITEQQPGQPEPEHPAPVLKLTGAVAASSTPPPSAPTSPSAASPSTASPSTASPSTAAPAAGGGSSGWWTLAAVAVLAVLVGMAVVVVRRRRAP